MKYRDLFYMKGLHPLKYYKLQKSDLTPKELDSVLKHHDEAWLKYLNFDFKCFRFTPEPIPK
jgi:hypothetical protein